MFYSVVCLAMTEKTRVPAVEGLFRMDPDRPHLLGTRCRSCGTYSFPAEQGFCRNPRCNASDLEEVELSRTGTLWSYTSAGYQPPPPFVAKEPFEPFAIAAVSLEREGMTILGQVAAGTGVDGLTTGMRMELVLDELYEDEERTYMTWKWKPADGSDT